eukprot:35740_1
MGACLTKTPKELQYIKLPTKSTNNGLEDLVYWYCHSIFNSNNNVIIPHEIILLCTQYCIVKCSFDKKLSSNNFRFKGLNNNIVILKYNRTATLFDENIMKSGKHHWKYQIVTGKHDIYIGIVPQNRINEFKHHLTPICVQITGLIEGSNLIDIYMDIDNECFGYLLNQSCDHQYFHYRDHNVFDSIDSINGYRLCFFIYSQRMSEPNDFQLEFLKYDNLNVLQNRITRYNDVDAYYGLIEGVHPIYNIIDKLKYYKLAIQDNTNNISWINQYIKALMEQNDLNTAYDFIIQRFSDIKPGNLVTLRRLKIDHELNGTIGKIIKYCLKTQRWQIKLIENNRDIMIKTDNIKLKLPNDIKMYGVGKIGIEFYNLSNMEKALNIFEYIDDETLMNNHWCFYVAYCYHHLYYFDDAMIYYQYHLTDNYHDKINYYWCIANMINIYYFRQDYKAVIRMCGMMRKRKEKNIYLYDNTSYEDELIGKEICDKLADSYAKCGKYDKAIMTYHIILKNKPNGIRKFNSLIRIGWCYHKKQDYKESYRYYTLARAADHDPNSKLVQKEDRDYTSYVRAIM